jgi:hypothetical protein
VEVRGYIVTVDEEDMLCVMLEADFPSMAQFEVF